MIIEHRDSGNFAQSIISIIREAYPSGSVGLHEPVFEGNEWLYVKECIDSGWVSSVGPFVTRFEKELQEYTLIPSATAVVNGTAGLHIAFKLLEVGPQDEVLIPSLTFVGVANAVTYCSAIPHFVDINADTLGVDPGSLEEYLRGQTFLRNGACFNSKTKRRIRALVAVHVFGHPVDLDPIVEVCRKFNLELIEDAAEAIGTKYKGRHVGHWGKVSVLSFNGNKTITTGGGGAILTHDTKLGQLAKHLTTTAKVAHPWDYYHDRVGFNYRMPNINAALGCAQLESLPTLISQKRALAAFYREKFKDVSGVKFLTEPTHAESNYWLNALILDDVNVPHREEILKVSHQQGILMRPAWASLPSLPMFQDCPRMDLSVAEAINQKILNIPSSPTVEFAYAKENMRSNRL